MPGPQAQSLEGWLKKPHGHGCVPFLPLVQLSVSIPVVLTYPDVLTTIGDHIRKARYERGLLQKEVADIIGVNVATVVNWEKNHTSPPIMLIPKIISFLGYNPLNETVDNTLSGMLKCYRQKHGLSFKNLAKLIPCDESTLSRLERNEGWFYETTIVKISYFLDI